MFERKQLAAVLAVLVVGSAGVVGAAAGTAGTAVTDESSTQMESSGSAYAGAHVSANVTADALVDYRADGATVMESVRVQSQSEVESSSDFGFDGSLDAMTTFAGAALSAESNTETSTTVTANSGASMTVHDNGHGTLVVAAEDQSQYVGLNLSSLASAEEESESRVVVTKDDGTKSTVLVVGDGSVTVNSEGNVTASLSENSRLVVRNYEQRDETAKQHEQMIVNGTAAAQVYLTQQAESSGEAAVDVVNYGQSTTVSVTQRAEGNVEMSVERTKSQGKVVITSVSEQTFDTADDIQVQVDGEAAVEASSYSELTAAADNGQTSKYMVQQSSSAQASADVVVALNHFSERNVTMTEDNADNTSGDDSDTTDGTQTTDGDDSNDGSDDGSSDNNDNSDSGTTTPGSSGPGFTFALAILALGGALGVALRRN